MRVMEEFYPEAFDEFWSMVAIQQVDVPSGLCADLSDEQYEALYSASIIHEKPLTNALGPNFKDILTRDKVISLFKHM